MGEVRWAGSARGPVTLYEFATNKETVMNVDLLCPATARVQGHGGADFFMVQLFYIIRAVEKNALT